MNPVALRTQAWYCLRAQPKREHVLASNLKKLEHIEVFLPRVRFKRSTSQGMAWVTEALFPGYLFTRFDWKTSLRRVQAAHGARGIVHFGDQVPVVPDETIEELRRKIGSTEPLTISGEFSPGDAVQITDGALQGLNAVVSRILPGRARIEVLMEILGRTAMIEIPRGSVINEHDERSSILPA